MVVGVNGQHSDLVVQIAKRNGHDSALMLKIRRAAQAPHLHAFSNMALT